MLNHLGNKSTLKIFLYTILIASLLSASLSFNTGVYVQASTGVFSDPKTVEEDVREFIQENLDEMSERIEFKITGVDACKVFLEKDEKGDIKRPVTLTDYFITIFREQMTDMKVENCNAYTRLSWKKWNTQFNGQITYGPGRSIHDIELVFVFNIEWRDLPDPLSARVDVISHARKFLDSSEYASLETDDEKLKAINDFICTTFQYDYRLFVEGADYVNYSAYEMIADSDERQGHPIGGYPRGVCQAYALYGYIMLDEAGYEAITIDGIAGGGPHAWNMVRVGDSWYHIDFTWNDPISENVTEPEGFPDYTKRQSGEGVVSERFLLRSDDAMRKNHNWDSEVNGFTYPVAPDDWDPDAETIKPGEVENPVSEESGKVEFPTSWKLETYSPEKTPTPTLKPTISPTTSRESVKEESVETIPTADDSEQSADPVTTVSPTKSSESDFSFPKEDESTQLSRNEKTVTISGRLIDGDGNPISNKRLELFATSMTTLTDSKGRYEFRDVKVGSYKIYIKEIDGTEIAELPIVICFGDLTGVESGEVTVRGGKLYMELVFSEGVLSIKSVSSPDNNRLIPIIVVSTVVIIAIIVILVICLMKKDNTSSPENYLE